MNAWTTTPTIAEVLAAAQTRGLDRLDAQLLLLHAMGRGGDDRAWLLAHDEWALTPQQWQYWQEASARRLAGEPLAYLTGHKEFYGLDLHVTPAVLIPRPETETLVDWALRLPLPQAACVLDLGTGSGAIALALARQRPMWQVWAVERSADALAVARGNGERLGLPVRWLQGDWLAALPADAPAFDLVVSNPPYIAPGDTHLAALAHEPHDALVASDLGLMDLARIGTDAPLHLRPCGWLLLEHGYNQADAVQRLLRRGGLAQVQTRPDLAGIPRCSGGILAVK